MNFQLQPLRPGDALVLAQLANNKKIWDCVRDRMPLPYTEKNAAAFIANVQQNKQALVRAIVGAEVGFMGTVGLHVNSAPYTGTAELAYWLGEQYWGRGIATTAVRRILALGFNHHQLRRIYATVFSFNRGSVRVLENNGFRQEIVARAAILKNDQVHDEITFGLLREEYHYATMPPRSRQTQRSVNTARGFIG